MAASCSWLLVPLDDRPCTRGFAVALAPLVGATVALPPPDALGWCREPGRPDALLAWLEAHHGATHAVVSIDMLAFGGLIASRELDTPSALVRERLGRAERALAALRERGTEVAAFDVLMRVPPYCTSPDDLALSETLHEWSRLAARQERGVLSTVQRLRKAWLERGLDPAFRQRYLSARRRNHEVNRAFMEWPQRGVVDFALLGMDDSRTEGFNVQERLALEPRVAAGASAILPGADELALLLMARQALHARARLPRVVVHLSPGSLRERVTRYEDRPVEALVRAHCAVLGIEPEVRVLGDEARPVASPGGDVPDLHLLVHGGPRAQAEAAVQLLPARPSRRHRDEARAVQGWLEQGALVAVADLGYANGGDRAFVQALGEAFPLCQLAAYAGWNTAGNTVGTALAHGVLRWLSLGLELDPAQARRAALAHAGFVLERLVDDLLYQAQVRQQVSLRCVARRLNVYALGEAHREVEAEVRDRLREVARPLVASHFAGQRVAGPGGTSWNLDPALELEVRLPWPRLFEVEVGMSELGMNVLG